MSSLRFLGVLGVRLGAIALFCKHFRCPSRRIIILLNDPEEAGTPKRRCDRILVRHSPRLSKLIQRWRFSLALPRQTVKHHLHLTDSVRCRKVLDGLRVTIFDRKNHTSVFHVSWHECTPKDKAWTTQSAHKNTSRWEPFLSTCCRRARSRGCCGW